MKFKKKLIAAILTVMMLMGHIAILENAVIAAGTNLLGQNSKTNHANVEFNSYFEDGVHSKTFEIGKEAKIYLMLKVNNTGYLKNGVVSFSNANFEVDSSKLNNDKVQSSNKNEIKLKQINNSNNAVIVEVPITMLSGEKVDGNLFNKIVTVAFTGTYIDENGKEKSIKKEISNELKWNGTAELELSGEITKYIPYEIGEEKGVLVQAKVKSGIKNNTLPVAKTKLEVTIPEIKINEEQAVRPQRITVIAGTTKGTNGKDNNSFEETNYNYNEETDKIVIEVNNGEENGKISWNKNAADEYLVTYVYVGEEVFNYAKQENSSIKGNIEVSAEVEAYNGVDTKLTKQAIINFDEKEVKGNIVDALMSATKSVSKGYVYANYDKQAKQDTDYEMTLTAKVADKTLVDSVEMAIVPEKYLNGDEQYNTNSSIYTKQVKISEAVFNKMLGEDGKIEITDKNGTKLAEITKDTEKDSAKNYVATITELNVNEIIIKTSKPVTDGDIVVNIVKAISAEQDIQKQAMQSLKAIESNVTINKVEKTAQTKLEEPVTKAEISIGTKNLSTIVKNENVELRVVLDTSSNKNALYKNPTLQIVLPENVETVNIKSKDILLDDELKIKSTKVVEKNGRKVILVELEGTQTTYMDNGNSEKEQANVIAKGANIVIKADITFKKLAPSANTNILLYYTNQNSNLYEKTAGTSGAKKARSLANTQAVGLAETGVAVTSPNGVVAENHMSGYAENKSISNMLSEKQEQIIETYGEAKEVTIGGTVVNNYSNAITNAVILGRTPFSGNKQIDGTEELGSNFTMKMKSRITMTGIESSKVRIYYSNNGEATTDLSVAANGWVENPTNLEEVKSYLITISGDITSGTQFDFNYKAELPANLAHNNSSYSTYKVYFTNRQAEVTTNETKVAGTIGLTTGEGPEAEVSVKSINSTVHEGQIVKMVATIKNTGKTKIENAKLHITAPEGTIHTELQALYNYYKDSEDKEKIITVGDINSGETVIKEYELKIMSDNVIEESDEGIVTVSEEDRTISNTIRLSADKMNGEVKSEPYSLTVKKGDISIVNFTGIENTKVLIKGDKISCKVKVENISIDKDLTNVILTGKIPNGMKIDNIYYTLSSNENEQKKENITINGNDFSVNVGTLRSVIAYMKENNKEEVSAEELMNINQTAYVYIDLTVEDFSEKYDLYMTAKADNTEIHYSNINTLNAEAVKLTLKQKDLDKQYVKDGSKYTYKFTIENTGNIASTSNKFTMKLPEELALVKAEYTYKGETNTQEVIYDGEFNVDIYSIDPKDKVELNVTVSANLLENKNDKEITTFATLEADGFNKIESNKVKAIIEYDEETHKKAEEAGNESNQGGQETPNTGRYKITGTAWEDVNKDGKRDETEQLLSGIQVVLLHKSNSQIVKDVDTGADKITTTDESGKYEFNNLKPDEYLVLFLYDAGKYSVTEYQKDGVAGSYNSDATSMKIVLNGEQRYAGVTNTIKISNENARDIDIGLYVAEKFDLRLDKYITKVTVTTPSSGTKVYNYNNSKITKREIYAKDVNNSSIIVEYKIVVTNEGQVAGYAKKLIDYLPEDAKFNSEINKDWYLANNNGALYNTSLENTKIEPGQSKEVTLILSVNITDKNIGKLINNNAEIYESYNEQGLEDIDSIPANMLEVEDDMSNADIIISIATGTIILYTTLTFAIIVLLGIGIFEIRRRVLTKENK